MARTEEYDVLVVGAGTSGTFAAGTAASEGLDVGILERKSGERAGHIACGDAVHDPTSEKDFPGPFDMERVKERSAVGEGDSRVDHITKGEYWDEEIGVRKTLEFGEKYGPGNVVDRYQWGQALVDEAVKQGADIHFDTVVNDVIQDGKVEGVRAVEDGENVEFRADLVVDAGGALSSFQGEVDFDQLEAPGGSFFEEPYYGQFGSAYREIIETEEDVDYHDALVIKPVPGVDEGMGYFWYFPRNEREINVGLGFQMSEESFPMVPVLKDDLEGRPEYEGAGIKPTLGSPDKLGSALGLRRPLDSAVAPGYIAVGDAGGMVSPTTGKGITGAAISGHSAGKIAAEAVPDEDVSEENLWPHNYRIFVEHGEGSKLAKQDVFNIAASAYEADELRGAVALLPIKSLMDAISGSSESYSSRELATIGAGLGWNNLKHFLRGRAPLVDGFDQLDVSQKRANEVIGELYSVSDLAEELKQHYLEFPAERQDFEDWRTVRDYIDGKIIEETGADPKY